MRKYCAVLILVLSQGASAGLCGNAVLPIKPASETQAGLAAALVRAGLDGRHEVIYDTTVGVPSSKTVTQPLEVEAPFAVSQHDYLQPTELSMPPWILIRPAMRAGALDLSLTAAPRNFDLLSREARAELRQSMAEGNLRVLGGDLRLSLRYVYSCQASPEIMAFKEQSIHHHTRFSIASSAAFLESLGVFDALARMRREHPGKEFFVRTVAPPLMTFTGADTRLAGALSLITRGEGSPLGAHVSFYRTLYRTIASANPALVGLGPAAATGSAAEDIDVIREAYLKTLNPVRPDPTLRTFQLRCPTGDFEIEGYETAWTKAVGPLPALSPPPAAEPLPLAAEVAVPEVKPPAPHERTNGGKSGTVTSTKQKRPRARKPGPRRPRPGVDAKRTQE